MRDRYLYQFIISSPMDPDYSSVVSSSYFRKQAVSDYLSWLHDGIEPNLSYFVHYGLDYLRRYHLFRLLNKVDVLSVYDGKTLVYKVSFIRLEK